MTLAAYNWPLSLLEEQRKTLANAPAPRMPVTSYAALNKDPESHKGCRLEGLLWCARGCHDKSQVEWWEEERLVFVPSGSAICLMMEVEVQFCFDAEMLLSSSFVAGLELQVPMCVYV